MRAAATLVSTLSLLASVAVAQSAVPGLPDAVPAGRATFRFLGFHVYDARLWVGADFHRSALGRAALALELAYARSFTAAEIAHRSLEEMRRAGALDPVQAGRWESSLRMLLPDVRPGDRLLGVHKPGQGAEFYRNGRLLGSIDDPEFATRFFGIWLGPQTSAPDLRDALLSGTRP